MTKKIDVAEIFGSDVFDDDTMKEPSRMSLSKR